MYASDHDAKLPAAIGDLGPNYLPNLASLHCDFDSGDGCSYIYYPPGKERFQKHEKITVILHCRATHPSELFSADGERDTPRHALLSPDLTISVVEGGEVELTDPPSRDS
jgi:hypothetical protein